MKFSQKFLSRRSREFSEKFIVGIWNPNILAWRDIIEDYLYISRKRTNNKLAMFKIQLDILIDIINNVKAIDEYRIKLTEFETDYEKGLISSDDFGYQTKYFESEINQLYIINIALREVIDGIVWRYFNFNRPILYLLADKEPLGPLRFDEGIINSLRHFAECFLSPKNIAILNDISNFLRTGDITVIKDDGTIELIEVKKSGGHGGRRITRQKQRMAEFVEFVNTGITEYDGLKFNIMNCDSRQIYYFKDLLNSINRARAKGYDSILIGSHLIVEVIDLAKINDPEKIRHYFKMKHKSVKENWGRKNDRVFNGWLIDKLEYSRNYIPYSILPYNIDICTDIIMGKVMIRTKLNFTEVMRMIEKNGCVIKDSMFFRSEDELKKLEGKQINDIPILKVKKGNCSINIPNAFFGRLRYELWSPKSLIEGLDEQYRHAQNQAYDALFINYNDDQRIWK
jgi:hypothetical protein